jgi:hypothetical protein
LGIFQAVILEMNFLPLNNQVRHFLIKRDK